MCVCAEAEIFSHFFRIMGNNSGLFTLFASLSTKYELNGWCFSCKLLSQLDQMSRRDVKAIRISLFLRFDQFFFRYFRSFG